MGHLNAHMAPRFYNELFGRLGLRVADLGVAKNRCARRLLVETPGYPRVVDVYWSPQCRWDHEALRAFLLQVREWQRLLSADPYRKRDLFCRSSDGGICLQHWGFCALCHT